MGIKRNRAPTQINLKKWFQIHTWSALASLIILLMLAVTGILIYPSDQFGLRQISIRSKWLPSLYETNTWGRLMRSVAVTPEGWLYATHPKGIFFSQDRGQSWENVTNEIPGSFDSNQGLFPPILAMQPHNPKIIIASKGKGLARSKDGGRTWEPYGNSDGEDLSQNVIQDITFDAASDLVFVVDENGLVYNRKLSPQTDEGWEMVSLGLPYGEQRGVGLIDWGATAFNLHNGQAISSKNWWSINDGFAVVLILLSLTGIVLWLRRRQIQSKTTENPKRLIKSRFFRTLHHIGGLVSWPMLIFFPLTGILLIHDTDFSIFTHNGLPTRWFPAQFDQNRWKGPVQVNLRALAVSPTDPSRLWAGHAYGLFTSGDGGQHWTPVGESIQAPILKWMDRLIIAPRWLEYVYVGNSRGLELSRDHGQHWVHLLNQPIDAIYADRETLYITSRGILFTEKFRSLAALTSLKWEKTPLAPPYGPNRSIRQTNLYQLLHDLHSGELLGTWFKYILDVVAISMLSQNVTGLVLWGLPRWKKWRRNRSKTLEKPQYAYQNRN
jgi:hypothetical protein